MIRTSLVLGALLVPLLLGSGCRIQEINVEIQGFDAFAVDGIWLYRWQARTGIFRRAGGIRLERSSSELAQYASHFEPGTELVMAVSTDAKGASGLTYPCEVVRDAQDPDRVRLRLFYLRAQRPGAFAASTFNRAGESALSRQTLPL